MKCISYTDQILKIWIWSVRQTNFLRFIHLKWIFRPYINSSKYGRNTGIVKWVRIHLPNHTDGIVDFFILTVQKFKKYD